MRNWRTTLSGVGVAIMAALTALAAAPAELGEASTVLPAEWKGRIFMAGVVASLILRCINANAQADKIPKPEPPKP